MGDAEAVIGQAQRGAERTGWGRATEHRRLAFLLAVATALRLAWLATPGYDTRIYYAGWARLVHQVGIGGWYGATFPSDGTWFNYPPLYLYVLRATGALYAALRPAGAWDDQLLIALLKLWPVAAELALGLLLYRFVRRHGGPRLALAGGAAYLLNPGIVWNTAYWGGIDALHALCLAAALFAAAEGRPARAWPLAALAVLGKLQALPGVLATVPPAVRGAGPRQLLAAALGALGIALAVTAPILLRGQLGAMAGALRDNLDAIPVASAYTHNLWWLVAWGDSQRPDTTALALGLTYRQAGAILFAGCALWALWRLWRRAADAAAVCETGAFLSFAFFLLTTKAHENWSFALFAPLAAAAALRPRYRALYAALPLTFLANLALHDPPLRDLLGRGFDVTARNLGLLNAAAQCALFGWWTVKLEGRRSRMED